jgi:hypothetical protein
MLVLPGMTVRRTFTLPDELFDRAERLAKDPKRRYSGLNDLVIDALDQFLVDAEEVVDSALGPRAHGGGPSLAATPPELDDPSHGFVRIFHSSKSQMSRQVSEMLENVMDAPSNLDSTALTHVEGATAFEPPHPVANGPDEPQFGLHNRDYPSLWSLRLLALASSDGPVHYSEFAWALNLAGIILGKRLNDIQKENPSPLDPSRMFPKVRESKKDQWGGFLTEGFTPGQARTLRAPFPNHALGRVQTKRAGDGRGGLLARGPLPQWGAVTFEIEGQDFLLGPTTDGLNLLSSMEGTSLHLPHSPDQATSFLSVLKEASPADYKSFVAITKCIAEEPTREELLDNFGAALAGILGGDANQSDKQISGTMQGYVSRAREWGLVEAELTRPGRRYALTDFGERWLESQR